MIGCLTAPFFLFFLVSFSRTRAGQAGRAGVCFCTNGDREGGGALDEQRRWAGGPNKIQSVDRVYLITYHVPPTKEPGDCQRMALGFDRIILWSHYESVSGGGLESGRWE